MKIGSLFSGYGGLDMAVSSFTGAEVVWHCEWDDAPSKILERNFPGVPNYRDVSKVDFSAVEPVDILTGGFPCQDLSLAGKRAGLKEGTRSGLWSEFARAIETIRPRLVVIENVRGLLSASAHSDVEQCAWCMGDLGGANLFCEHWELFSETWPTSGMTRSGQVFELPTQERLTTVSESSLLRSPKASEGQGGALGEAEATRRGNTVGVRDQVMDLVASQGLKVSRADSNGLLSTPTSQAAKHGETPDVNANSYGSNLWNVEVLFPTPQTMDTLPARSGEARERQLHRGGDGSRRSSSGNLREDILELLPTVTTSESTGAGSHGTGGDNLRTVVADGLDWGKFEPSIRRWEIILNRPAPAPTKPDGKDGAHRLSSKFTEWMMGLPEGWITDVGLTRNEELKACGNGVVPQQAELALGILLNGASQPIGGGQVNLPTPTVSDIFTDRLASSQQKDGSMHSVTLPQAVQRIGGSDD